MDQSTVLGQRLFFAAEPIPQQPELYVSDGTPGGTSLIEVDPAGGSGPFDLVPLGARMFLAAHHTTTGYEPWTSDGTPTGTALVLDVAPGPASGTFIPN